MSELFLLFFEFFKTGLFAVGGGLATIPFLQEMTVNHDWFTISELTDMIAVAESTPGPIGVNMATYAGYASGEIIGAVIASIGLVFPSVIVIILVSKFLNKFRNSDIVNNAFYGLRPAVAGLITAAFLTLFKLTIFAEKFTDLVSYINIKNLLLFGVFTFMALKLKKVHPILIIALGAICGIIFKL